MPSIPIRPPFGPHARPLPWPGRGVHAAARALSDLLVGGVGDDGDRYVGCHGNRSVERSPVFVDTDELLCLVLREAVEVEAEADAGKVGEVVGVACALDGDLGPL